MIPIVVFFGVAAVLFVGAYLSKRRFGLLGLALTAGASLSTLWGYDAGLMVQAFGVIGDGSTSQAVAQSALILLPAILLLFHGYAYKNKLARVIGSLMFALFALALLVEPLGHVLPLSGVGSTVFNWIVANKSIIIGAGIICSIADIFFTKPVHMSEKHKK